MDLHLSIVDGFVSCKMYDKRDDFDFEIVNFPFLDGDVPRAASYGVYISQLIRFARVSITRPIGTLSQTDANHSGEFCFQN